MPVTITDISFCVDENCVSNLGETYGGPYYGHRRNVLHILLTSDDRINDLVKKCLRNSYRLDCRVDIFSALNMYVDVTLDHILSL